MTQFEKELRREGEEIEKVLRQRTLRPTERHAELATTDPLAAAELSRQLLDQLKSDLRLLQSSLQEKLLSSPAPSAEDDL